MGLPKKKKKKSHQSRHDQWLLNFGFGSVCYRFLAGMQQHGGKSLNTEHGVHYLGFFCAWGEELLGSVLVEEPLALPQSHGFLFIRA